MLGSSRTSMALLNEAIDAAYSDPSLGTAGSDLLTITDLVGREKTLRHALADSGRPEAERVSILRRLLQDKVCPLAMRLAEKAVGARWSNDRDLVDALESAGASALVGAAEREGRADAVADELFRFGRLVDASPELQLTLSSASVPGAAKQQIISDLLAGRAEPTTVQLAGFVLTHLRGRRIDQALDSLVELAAVRRGELSAKVKVAQPLDDDQRERLVAALRNLYRQPVQLSIDIDPSVIGGISVQVGDEIIDGTIAHRLEEARRRLAG